MLAQEEAVVEEEEEEEEDSEEEMALRVTDDVEVRSSALAALPS
jgi:hypothetical protein